jgi:hypothetical protein
MTALAGQIRTCAELLIPYEDSAEKLTGWIARTGAADLPFLHSFATGLERDRAAEHSPTWMGAQRCWNRS